MKISLKIILTIILISAISSSAFSLPAWGKQKFGISAGISYSRRFDPLAGFQHTGINLGIGLKIPPAFNYNNWLEFRLNAGLQYYISKHDAAIPTESVPSGRKIAVDVNSVRMYSLSLNSYWFFRGNREELFQPFFKFGIGVLKRSKLIMKSKNDYFADVDKSYNASQFTDLGFGADIAVHNKPMFRVYAGLAFTGRKGANSLYAPITLTYFLL